LGIVVAVLSQVFCCEI